MIYRGAVLEPAPDGRVWVRIPALTGDSPVGPLPAVPAALAAGEDVLIAALRGRTDDMLVVSRERVPAYVPAWEEISGKPSTFAPSPHSHTAADISSGVLNSARLPAATSVAPGSMSAADKAKLDAATSAPTASTLAFRNSAGRIQVAEPGTDTTAATPRSYVDTQIGTRAAAAHTHPWGDITGAPTTYAPSAHMHTYADITGVVPTSALPPLAIQDTFTAGSQAEMLALVAQRGDVAIRTDVAKTFILSADTPGTLSAWKEFLATGQVVSVAGKTGVVLLVKGDVGLGNVDNTADLAKPISTAVASALAGKSDTGHTHVLSDLVITSLGANQDLDTYQTTGLFHQGSNASTSAALHYPENAAGLLEVYNVASFVYQRYMVYTAAGADFYWRTKYSTLAWSDWQQIANTNITTTTAPGLMHHNYKNMLDAATAANTDGTLVMRYNGGETNMKGIYLSAAPVSASHATRKDYVDNALALKLDSADALATKIATPKPATDLPATYPLGLSTFGLGSDATWPLTLCTVFTVRDSAARTFQMLVSKTTGRIMTRTETDGPAWTAWREAVDSGALSSTTSNNSVAQRTAAGNLYANRFYADGAQAPEANSLTRRDYVDAQIATCQPAETDTNWVTTGLTITAGTDWTVTGYRVRAIGALAYVRVTLTYGGTGITSSATGDISPDVTLCTLPTGWRPTESLPINIAQNGSREWFGQLSTSGAVLLTHGLPSQTLANGSTITVRGMFFIV